MTTIPDTTITEPAHTYAPPQLPQTLEHVQTPGFALATRRELTPEMMIAIVNLAPTIHKSRLAKVDTPDQAVFIMMKAYELGLPFTAGFDLIHIIDGKLSLSPRGALAIIYQSGLLAGFKLDESVPDACTVWMKRVNGLHFQVTYTLDDAKRAGLVKAGGNWEKYPPNMLRWRAIGFCSDVVFPDLLSGMKRADEFGAQIDSDGNVVSEA
jgi:hypothetical protein